MCELFTRALVSVLLIVALIFPASVTTAATMDDELTVDPTTPLLIPAQGNSGEGDTFGFDGLGLGDLFATYELSSVLIRAEDRIAVINEQRVRVGDSLGAARVAAIEADHVELNINGSTKTLELYGESIKTAAAGDE